MWVGDSGLGCSARWKGTQTADTVTDTVLQALLPFTQEAAAQAGGGGGGGCSHRAGPEAAAVGRHCPQVACGLGIPVRSQQPTQSGTYPRRELNGGHGKFWGHRGGNCELTNSCVDVSMVCPRGGEAWEEAILSFLFLHACSTSLQHPLIPAPQIENIISRLHSCFPQLYKLYATYNCAYCVHYTIAESYSPHRQHRVVSLLSIFVTNGCKVTRFRSFSLICTELPYWLIEGLPQSSFRASLCSRFGKPRRYPDELPQKRPTTRIEANLEEPLDFLTLLSSMG